MTIPEFCAEICQYVYISWQKNNTFFKNFYRQLLANSEYCEIFKSIYYEEHLQTAASENVFMKLKKKLKFIDKITVPAF